MTIIRWSPLQTRTGNLLGALADGLPNGAESNTLTYDNSVNCDLYAFVTVKLGSIASVAGGSISVRITFSDGTDVSNKVGGLLIPFPLLSGTSAKIGIEKATLVPASLRLSIINNSGVSLAASGNELYLRPFNEDVL